MICYMISSKDENTVEFYTTDKEMMRLAVEFLEILADAMAHRNRVERITKRIIIDDEKGE